MQLFEAAEEQMPTQGKAPTANVLPWKGAGVEVPVHCAYNQTRECFLGLAVSVADLHYTALAERMKSLVLRSGEGLWITPYRGLPAADVPGPLDVVYLDAEGRVLDAVESFPTFHARLACPLPASVLALPAHSIYSSQTQPGDRLVVCAASEMEERLETIARERPQAGLVQSAVILREQPLWSGGSGILEFESCAGVSSARPQPRHEMGLAQPGPRLKASTPWAERWWSPDPRQAPRKAASGVAAYHWNGVPPEAHGIRDLSSSGVYLVTEERWYPGKLVLMMQSSGSSGEPTTEYSLPVQTRAVRWGCDGLGLQFVLADRPEAGAECSGQFEEADRAEFARFLEQLKRGQ